MTKKYIVSLVATGMLAVAGLVGALEITPVPVDVKVDSKTDINTNTDSARLLPTVNKKSTASVTISDFDDDAKQKITTNIQYALDTNPELKYAAITQDSVMVNYLAPAKFLGLFNRPMNINVVADVDGRIKVKFPWYRFLFKTDFSKIAEEMNSIFQNNQTDLEMVKKQDPAAAQGLIFVQISNILKARHDISVNAAAKTE